MNNIPKFPAFRFFTINDIVWYKKFYIKSKLNPYSDVYFDNLLSWFNIKNNIQISKLDRNTIIFKYDDPLKNNDINFLPLSKKLKNRNIKKIFEYLEINNFTCQINEVPKKICKSINAKKYKILEDKDNYEYILSTAEQTNLLGNRFYRQRNRINRFNREYKDDDIKACFYKNFDDNLISLFTDQAHRKKMNHKEEKEAENVYEKTVMIKNITQSIVFQKKALIIKKNKDIIAFAIISFLDKKTAAVNHIKVDYSIINIFHYTIFRLAKILSKKGISEINFEQDLGIQGMRQFKKSLRPSRMLEKVTICKKDS